MHSNGKIKTFFKVKFFLLRNKKTDKIFQHSSLRYLLDRKILPFDKNAFIYKIFGNLLKKDHSKLCPISFHKMTSHEMYGIHGLIYGMNISK